MPSLGVFEMDRERLEKLKELKKTAKKNKPFKTLSTKEKDELLETVCKMLGLLD